MKLTSTIWAMAALRVPWNPCATASASPRRRRLPRAHAGILLVALSDQLVRLELPELLDVTRIESGRLALDRQLFDLSEFVEEVVGRYEKEAERLGCASLELDSGVGPERADAHRLYMNCGLRISSHHFSRALDPSAGA